MGLSVETLALSKKFTRDTVIGLGALKGSPCTIKTIEEIEGGNRITFEWTGNDGTTKNTQTLDVLNGVAVENIEINDDGHLICTMTDGRTIDAGKLPTGTTTAQDLSAAVNELDAALDTASTQIGDLNSSVASIVNNDTGLLKQSKDYTDTKVGTLTNLSTTEKDNVVVAINECFAAIGAGRTASVVSVAAKETANEGYLKTYVISQGGNSVGEIDIPKDLVVTSGSVIVVDDDNPVASLTNGTYLKLTIANQEAPVYIDVAKMCDVYTAKAGATQVQLAISATNEVSATIVAGSITATELGTDAVETAKIKDGAVTEGKLDTELATKIGKIATNETAIGTLNANASTEGSVDYKIAQAIGGLDTYVAITEAEINALFTATP